MAWSRRDSRVIPVGQKYGHRLHFWDLAAGKLQQTVDLGAQHQMALKLRPSHDPNATWGFVGVVVSTEDLSASVVIMVSRGGDAPANLQPWQSTSRDSQPCSATWASRAR